MPIAELRTRTTCEIANVSNYKMRKCTREYVLSLFTFTIYVQSNHNHKIIIIKTICNAQIVNG